MGKRYHWDIFSRFIASTAHMKVLISTVLAGLALRTEEFAHAFTQVYFNAFVQIFSFGVVSSIVFGFSRLMIEIGAISKILGD